MGKLADETVEQVTGETYGPLKALCEQAVMQTMPGRALIVRPALIVGPHDPTDRFTYWPWRVAQGGEVLAPGSPERAVQFIDVRDLAAWIVLAAETGYHGIFNAISLPGEVTMGALLDTCAQVSRREAKITWVSEEFLLNNKVGEWIEMPLWISESKPEYAGFFAFDTSKAIATGLKFRPGEKTAQTTLEWINTRPADHPWRAGLSRQREKNHIQGQCTPTP